jgi:hypothetical protein
MLRAQSSIAVQSRKSPSGIIARAAGSFRNVFSAKVSLPGSRAPMKTRWSPGVDRLPESGDLLGLGGHAQVHSFGVGGVGAEWAGAEQPHRPMRQQVPVAHDECRRVLSRVRQVSGTADDEPLVAAQITRLLNRSSLGMLSCQRENLHDAFGNLRGGTVFAGIPNENQ